MAQCAPSVYNASLDYGYNSSTYPDSYNKCTEELYGWPEVAILWCADTYVQTEYNCVSPYTCDQQPWCDLGPKSGYANRRILCATAEREYPEQWKASYCSYANRRDVALEWEEVLIKAGVKTCICGYAYDLYQTSINYSAPNYFGDFCPPGFCTNQASFEWECQNGNVVKVSE